MTCWVGSQKHRTMEVTQTKLVVLINFTRISFRKDLLILEHEFKKLLFRFEHVF